jgi:hypothetical protein
MMKIVLKNSYVDYHLAFKWSSGLLEETLQLLVPKKSAGSLAITNTVDYKELQYFIALRDNMSNKIYGTENIPGYMLAPSHKNIKMPSSLHQLLCEWYSILYEKNKKEIQKYMDTKMNQHTRLIIGDEIFGSKIGGRYVNNSIIQAKWKAFGDDSSDIYPGEVQYYFEHVLHMPDGPKTHQLAYVRWFKPAPSFDVRFKHKFIDGKSNTELWSADYYEEGTDSIIAVHRIYGRAIKINYRCGKKSKNNYVSIIPLNRRFNI